jgi:hypothetical protein
VVGIVALLLGSTLLLLPQNASAAQQMDETDVDFAANSPDALLTGTEIVGTGIPASVQVLKDFPAWLQMSPPAGPTGRRNSAMAYDSVNDRIILFGGNDGGFRDDTWSYDIPSDTWTLLSPSTRPPAREHHGMAFAVNDNTIVLYGGSDGGGPRNDTWEFDVTTDNWRQVITAPNPGGSPSPPLVYDSINGGGVVVFVDATGAGFQTWVYDPIGETWTNRAPSASPPSRTYHVLGRVYDPNLGEERTVLHAGTTPGFPPVIRQDTWEYDYAGNAWFKTMDWDMGTPPTNRTGMGGTYRSATGDLFIFGGYTGTGYLDETWRYHYDLGFPQWDLITVGTSPPARDQTATAYSSVDNAVLLQAGQDTGGNINDTWVFSLSYRPAGFYRSNRMDGGNAATVWNWFAWNNTSQPPSTLIRYQLAIENNPDVSLANFVGPSCTSGDYYTSNPSTISVACNTGRYLWYNAQLIATSGATPVLQNITFNYTAPIVPPFITETAPFNTEFLVDPTRSIWVNFSEAMDTGATTIETVPALTFGALNWLNGDSTLQAIPSPQMNECTQYRVWVNGTDADSGQSLVPGPVPNPWIFVTSCTPPEITWPTSPYWDEQGVSVNAPIVMNWTEPMDTTPGALQWIITPNIALTPTWTLGDTQVTLNHASPLTDCTWYEMNVTAAQDKGGVDYIGVQPGIEPWRFRTLSPACPPEVTATVPANRTLFVNVNDPIDIAFSMPMDTTSVVWQPNSQPAILNPVESWNVANDVLTINHDPLLGCMEYRMEVTTAMNFMGTPMAAPYTWWFVTDGCTGPYIWETDPVEGQIDVPVTQPIRVNWSDPMNTFVGYTLSTGTPVVESWDGFFVTWTLTPLSPYPPCTDVTLTVLSAQDQSSRPFLNPGPRGLNPLTFRTFCPNPVITSTDPINGQGGVTPLTYPITVNFDKPMRQSTTNISTVPPMNFTLQWSNNNMTMTAMHTELFQCPGITYTATVVGDSFFGFPLVPGPVPNPWDFTPLCPGASPYLTLTTPVDLDSNVALNSPIDIDFSEPMNTATVLANAVPGVTFGYSWTLGDTHLQLTHTGFLPCQGYDITVTGNDADDGNALVAGPVPNPWHFDTVCTLGDPAGLVVTRQASDIFLDWSDVPSATEYHVYHSVDRFAAFPGGWTQAFPNPLVSQVVLSGHNADGLTHYYLVRASNGVSEGGNSSMGVKRPLVFTHNPLLTNINWFSLPYRSIYNDAASIAAELTSSQVDVIGKWDAATQRHIVYFFARGSWRGTNFAINPGDGLYLGIVSSFTWVVTGTDTLPNLVFTVNPVPMTNYNWVGIPYTGIYNSASDIMQELEPFLTNTRITEIGLWDAATQTAIVFYYNGIFWVGVDFAINPGDGIYFIITSSFVWTPALLTPPV